MAFNSYRPFGAPGIGSMQNAQRDPIARLKQQIGFSEEPVQDAQGYWTIGYGERLNEKPGGPKPYATISEPIADEALRYRFAQDPEQFGSFLPAAEGQADPQRSNQVVPAAFFGGNGSVPQSADPQTPKQAPDSEDWLDRIFKGMSRAELQDLKYKLDRAALATEAFGIVAGGVEFFVDPSKLSVVITIGGTQLISLGLQYLSSLLDEYINMRQD